MKILAIIGIIKLNFVRPEEADSTGVFKFHFSSTEDQKTFVLCLR